MLMPYKDCVHTITTDNSREFAGHLAIAGLLDADLHFAYSFSSWERGANKYAYSLFRQFGEERDGVENSDGWRYLVCSIKD